MWKFTRIVSIQKDLANKYRARILMSDGKEERCFFLKFHRFPLDKEISIEVNKYLVHLNNPPPKEENLEEKVTRLEEEIRTLKNA